MSLTLATRTMIPIAKLMHMHYKHYILNYMVLIIPVHNTASIVAVFAHFRCIAVN